MKNQHVPGLIEVKEKRGRKVIELIRLIKPISLCISLGIVIFMFNLNFKVNGSEVALSNSNNISEELLDIPKTKQPPPPKPKKVQPEIIEVPDEEEIEEEIEIDLDVEMTEETVIEKIIFKEATLPEEEEVDEIFTIVEKQPSPVGGMSAFYKYINDKIKYPAQARRMGIEGKVFVEFVVDKDGSITDVKAVKGIGAGCDREAEKVIRSAPKWKPGKQRGRAVKVRMILPITFKLG